MATDGDASHDAVRARVVGRLRARRGELVETIFARVRDREFGQVGADDAEYIAGLRAAVAGAVEYVLEGIERGDDVSPPTTTATSPTRAIPAVASEQARRAARVGVSLDTVLRRYVLGSELLRDLIMEEADRGEEHWSPPIPRGALRAVMRAQASVLQRMLAAITVEYRDELEQVGYGSPTGGGSPQLPALLGNPSARRARECLLFLAEQGRLGLSPSNREIAAGIGVTHQPQISRLLAQLAAEGLVSKRSQGAGKRNVLQLTERGEQVVRILLERGPGRMADNP